MELWVLLTAFALLLSTYGLYRLVARLLDSP
jgi:hypothetical protein